MATKPQKIQAGDIISFGGQSWLVRHSDNKSFTLLRATADWRSVDPSYHVIDGTQGKKVARSHIENGADIIQSMGN